MSTTATLYEYGIAAILYRQDLHEKEENDQTIQSHDKAAKDGIDHDDPFVRTSSLLHHFNEHVVIATVMIKTFHENCEWCKMLLKTFGAPKRGRSPNRQSDDSSKPANILYITTVPCFLGKHKKCYGGYKHKEEELGVLCLCKCHKRQGH